jgi:hypothetical protein
VRCVSKDLVPPRMLYRYRSFTDPYDSIRKALAQNRWWFGSRRAFDDEDDFIFPGVRDDPRLAWADLELLKRDTQEVLDRTGVFCLSESPNDIDLWRRYASDGAGICIELESDYITDPDFGPFKVRYSNEPKPLWNHFAGPDKRRKLTDAHLLQKNISWKNQAEWRCIRHWEVRERPTADRYYSIAVRALMAIIFGWKLTQQAQRQIIEWVQMGGWWRVVILREAQPEDDRIRIREYSSRW